MNTRFFLQVQLLFFKLCVVVFLLCVVFFIFNLYFIKYILIICIMSIWNRYGYINNGESSKAFYASEKDVNDDISNTAKQKKNELNISNNNSSKQRKHVGFQIYNRQTTDTTSDQRNLNNATIMLDQIPNNEEHAQTISNQIPVIKDEVLDNTITNTHPESGCTCCFSLFNKRPWNRIQLVIQFFCGVIPSVVYTPIMDTWQRKNESQPDHYGAHDIVHYLTRFGVIFFFFMNFVRIWLDYIFCSYYWKRRIYRKINRALAMVMCCLLALNDRQLDKAFLTDKSSLERIGFTKQHYQKVLLGVMVMQFIAVVACLVIPTEESFKTKVIKTIWKNKRNKKIKAYKAEIFGQ